MLARASASPARARGRSATARLLAGLPATSSTSPLRAAARRPAGSIPANSRYVLAVLDRAIARLPRRRVRRDGHRAGAEERRSTTPASPSPATPNTSPSSARAPHVVMMLVGGGLRVALATTHLPLSRRAARDHARGPRCRRCASSTPTCSKRFGIARPRILVAGPQSAQRRIAATSAARRSR